MENNLNSPEPSPNSQDKCTDTHKFDYDKYGIGKHELVNEVQKASKQSRFPVEVFPLSVQEIILATNETLDFPIDFIGSSILFAASVAIGNSYKVEIKKGFHEGAVIYLAIVSRPGSNKTHPLSFAIQPIIDRDKETYREYEKGKAEYDSIINLSKKEKQAEGITGDPQKPAWKKFLLTDYTPEALAEVHRFNKRGIGVYCDELAGWIKNFGRYTKGSEMEFWISNFNSKPINIDRKTNEPIYIPVPFISVCGTIQTGILNVLAKDSRTQNGFIDRILFCFPDNLQKKYWSESEINPVIIKKWNGIITKILDLPVVWDDTLNPVPQVLHYTPEAKKLLYKWQRENTDKCNSAESEVIAGIYSKLDMYVARISLILQLMRWSCNEGNKETVSIESVKGAIDLIEYFRLAATKVYSIISSNNPLDKLTSDKRNFYEALPETFTTEQAVQAGKQFELKERTVKYFLTERELFNNVKHGNYEKKF